MTIDERVSQFIVASMARTFLVSKGEMTEAQALEENKEAIMRLRVELSTEEFQEFMDGIGLEAYRRAAEISALGRPSPGNDPLKPN